VLPEGAPDLVRAHHGSLAREQRLEIEDALKAGRLPGLVATSSLELGIDMGAIDLVVQVEAPPSVASGLQRIGRAGHQVGEPSRGRIFPKYRGDLVVAAVTAQRMTDGLIEETRVPRNPLDVLSQQVVAMCAAADPAALDLAEVEAVALATYSFAELSHEAFEGVLDMLSGRYPSDEFAELRPRLTWDRLAGTITARKGARMLAVTSGGTIPDRGLYRVVTPDGGKVGELDEEMVYESRVGETFLLGASTWRIEDIDRDRVVVTPAPGVPGKMPFWHGDNIGRPLELGRAVGAFLREAPDLTDDELHDRHASTRSPCPTCAVTWASSWRPPAPCPPTARSWSSASVTSWATGGSASCRRSGPGSMPPGRWPSRPRSAARWMSRSRPSGATTGSWCACPRPTTPRLPMPFCSTPTRSRSW